MVDILQQPIKFQASTIKCPNACMIRKRKSSFAGHSAGQYEIIRSCIDQNLEWIPSTSQKHSSDSSQIHTSHKHFIFQNQTHQFLANPSNSDDLACLCHHNNCNTYNCQLPVTSLSYRFYRFFLDHQINLIYLAGGLILILVCLVDLFWYLPARKKYAIYENI